ncbi:hypothetical protein QUA00_26630 [Microcoleus sp. T2B6]
MKNLWNPISVGAAAPCPPGAREDLRGIYRTGVRRCDRSIDRR